MGWHRQHWHSGTRETNLDQISNWILAGTGAYQTLNIPCVQPKEKGTIVKICRVNDFGERLPSPSLLVRLVVLEQLFPSQPLAACRIPSSSCLEAHKAVLHPSCFSKENENTNQLKHVCDCIYIYICIYIYCVRATWNNPEARVKTIWRNFVPRCWGTCRGSCSTWVLHHDQPTPRWHCAARGGAAKNPSGRTPHRWSVGTQRHWNQGEKWALRHLFYTCCIHIWSWKQNYLSALERSFHNDFTVPGPAIPRVLKTFSLDTTDTPMSWHSLQLKVRHSPA